MKFLLTIVFGVLSAAFGYWIKCCLDDVIDQKKQNDNVIAVLFNITFMVWLISFIPFSVCMAINVGMENVSVPILFISFIGIISSISSLIYFCCVVLVIICEDKSGDKSERKSSKSRKIDMLLCMFLGWAGAHRFYEGKIFTGFLWLLTCGCLGIGYIIDYIKVFAGDSTDKDGLPISRWN